MSKHEEMARNYCPDGQKCQHGCTDGCKESRQESQFLRDVGGYICPKHGRVYGSCASCHFDHEERMEEDYKQRLRNRIAELESALSRIEAETEARVLEMAARVCEDSLMTWDKSLEEKRPEEVAEWAAHNAGLRMVAVSIRALSPKNLPTSPKSVEGR